MVSENKPQDFKPDLMSEPSGAPSTWTFLLNMDKKKMIKKVISILVSLLLAIASTYIVTQIFSKEEKPFWIVNHSAFKDIRNAQTTVDKLKQSGESKAGYLWIPNHKSLSYSRLFQVYSTKTDNCDKAQLALCQAVKKFGNPKIYAVLVSNKSEADRKSLCCSEWCINDKKLKHEVCN